MNTILIERLQYELSTTYSHFPMGEKIAIILSNKYKTLWENASLSIILFNKILGGISCAGINKLMLECKLHYSYIIQSDIILCLINKDQHITLLKKYDNIEQLLIIREILKYNLRYSIIIEPELLKYMLDSQEFTHEDIAHLKKYASKIYERAPCIAKYHCAVINEYVKYYAFTQSLRYVWITAIIELSLI